MSTPIRLPAELRVIWEARRSPSGTTLRLVPERSLPRQRRDAFSSAHELAHVVQQRRGGSFPSPMARVALEREARQAADAFIADRPSQVVGVSSVHCSAPREPCSLREDLDISTPTPEQVEDEVQAIHAWLSVHKGDEPGNDEVLAILPKLEAVRRRHMEAEKVGTSAYIEPETPRAAARAPAPHRGCCHHRYRPPPLGKTRWQLRCGRSVPSRRPNWQATNTTASLTAVPSR